MGISQYADISAYQGIIDWQKYVAWAKSFDGTARVAMKATEGAGFTDARFAANRAGALAAGVDSIIFYHYARSDLNAAIAEADWLTHVVGLIRAQDLFMLDYEQGTPLATAQWAYDFLTRLESLTGRTPIIYASTSYIRAHLQDARLAHFPLVLANWTYDPTVRPACPAPWKSYAYMQYSDKATIPGIQGAVDANVYIEDRPMTDLNVHGEVADFLDDDQFIVGRSAYECVAYCAALIKFAGAPGHGSSGTARQIADLAQAWYAREEGSNLASNTNGMSLSDEYDMLAGIGLRYQVLSPTVTAVKQALGKGYPVLLCGAEIGFYDLDLGHIPYSWPPSGNHCIVASGVDGTGNLLVHDCASIGSAGVRPGPRRYDISKMQLVSATAILVPWIGEDMVDINNPWVKSYFTQTSTSPDRWHCAKTGFDLFAGILAGWRAMNGAPRLPLGPEVKCGRLAVYQECESGIVLYDPGREFDAPGGPWAPCYLLKLESDLAKKLLGSGQTAPADTTALIAAINAIADGIAPLVAQALVEAGKL
jgi:GH25 family lysozyme M1 (1,4-beta-N-acetylmuramidase)